MFFVTLGDIRDNIREVIESLATAVEPFEDDQVGSEVIKRQGVGEAVRKLVEAVEEAIVELSTAEVHCDDFGNDLDELAGNLRDAS